MEFPEGLKYTKDHEWVKMEGDVAIVGITQYALDQLGDVVYIELPETEESYDKDSSVGTIESTKTVSDIFSPVNGEVTEVNTELDDNIEILTKDPYTEGWLFKAKTSDNLQDLMSSQEYAEFIQE